ncbi:hypothetical protein [Kineosporia succinea]|uniref:Uncharacterized protein n=1 Tax=Kineosporia succinea TaxID=84632 RepID=A0ABT9P9F0_9ACTN|nr:hypothetical protein [Kineosporia succinea]MDP9829326.1 hypothetical protein [Kineosporia succinea]
MADRAKKTDQLGPGVFGTWLQTELDALNRPGPGQKLPGDRGVMWLVRTLTDPVTGGHPAKATVSGWLASKPSDPLKPPSVRAIAALFNVPRRFVRELVAQDLGDADDDEVREWPHFLPVEARRLSADGRAFVRDAARFACTAEGLIAKS